MPNSVNTPDMDDLLARIDSLMLTHPASDELAFAIHAYGCLMRRYAHVVSYEEALAYAQALLHHTRQRLRHDVPTHP